jgi:hypothetical protein
MPHTNAIPKFPRLPALALLAALPVFSQAQPSSTEFGMLGLARGQTMLLSVVAFPTGPCFAQIGFQNTSGGNYPVGPPNAPINPGFPVGPPDAPINPGLPTVVLGPGQGAFVDLNGNMVVAQFGQRVEVHPVVVVVQPLTPGVAPSACRALVEILDSFSGFSLLLAPGRAVPSGAADFGLQGVAFAQVVRLNILAGAGGCAAMLGFRDKNGVPSGPADKPVTLSAGQSDFLDLVGSSLVSGFGQRAEVRPVVTMTPGATGGGSSCRATVEVWDVFSGRTWAAIP